MSSIDAGKQQVSFSWYKGLNSEAIKDNSLNPPSIQVTNASLPSSYDLNSADLLPSNFYQPRSLSSLSPVSESIPVMVMQSLSSPQEPLPELPSSHSLLEPTAYTQEFNSVVDVMDSRLPPMEPSRIRRAPIIQSSPPAPHLAIKHPHPSEDAYAQHYGEFPIKKVKVDEQYSDDDFWDFNTLAGGYGLDFLFTRRVPSDIVAMEEAERKDRMSRGSDPVFSGKFHLIQKEFMSRVNKPISMSNVAPLIRGLSDSMSDLKDTIVEKGHHLIDSSKDAIGSLNPHFLRSTLNQIAVEADQAFRPLSLEGEKIEFVWPRVPDYVKDAEELARSERTSHGVPPVLFGKWKILNNEFKSKWGTTGFALAKIAPAKKSLMDSASALVGKASNALDDAVQYTTGMMENLGLKVPESARDLEWVRLQQEKERARRINESLLSPSFDARKVRVEKQLLKTVNALKSKSEL